MADETETSTETATTETTPANDAAVETSALGGAAVEGADTTTDKAVDDKGEADATKGAVTAPDVYELVAPEGTTIDPADIEAATPVLKDLGLTNEQANKLVPVVAQALQRQADKMQTAQLEGVASWRKERAEERMADPEVGGAKAQEALTYAAKALDTFGAPKGSPFRNALDESGWGEHVEMVRMFAKIGRAVGEDSDFVRGDAGAKVPQDKATILYPNDVPKGG